MDKEFNKMKLVFPDTNTIGEDIDLNVFCKYGKMEVYPFTAINQVKERVSDADIVITNKCIMNDITLKGSKVKLICITATGIDNVDVNYCLQQGIAVCNVKGYSTESVVMHTFTLLLNLSTRMDSFIDYTKSGKYINDTSFKHLKLTFNELAGKTFGVAGMGTIGKRAAQVAESFGCKILYWSSSNSDRSTKYKRVDFITLLSESDIISIHSPLTEKTRKIFNRDAFEKMKNNSFLVNVGRGDIIDEQALTDAIINKKIGGAALDVLYKEPMSANSPYIKILNYPNFIITPHIAWAAVESRQRCIDEICLNIDSFLSDEMRNRIV